MNSTSTAGSARVVEVWVKSILVVRFLPPISAIEGHFDNIGIEDPLDICGDKIQKQFSRHVRMHS